MSDQDAKVDLAARRADVRGYIDDSTGLMLKAANSLLVGHGGGFVGCLSQLKDYDTNPHLKHIGLLIAAFGLGFIVTVIGLIDLSNARSKWLLAVFNRDGKPFPIKVLTRGMALLYVSTGILLLTVLAICWRFFWL